MVSRNITKLTETLWVGGDTVYSPGVEIDRVKKLGLFVVDTRDRAERRAEPSWRKLGLEGINVEMFDDPIRGTKAHSFLELHRAIAPFVKEERPILIHCHMGINRSPSAAWFMMMMFDSMKARVAFESIFSKRPHAGMAYVTPGLEAVMLLRKVPRSDREKMLAGWEQFQKKHWTKRRVEHISNVIDQRHTAYERANIWMDEEGMAHGTAV